MGRGEDKPKRARSARLKWGPEGRKAGAGQRQGKRGGSGEDRFQQRLNAPENEEGVRRKGQKTWRRWQPRVGELTPQHEGQEEKQTKREEPRRKVAEVARKVQEKLVGGTGREGCRRGEVW